ncbi:diacylglycerol kinase family protein [uncultured Croceitalea sp.]|uniref:diacylglycerol kinase family protein n=1 Tax=uncultured Croceitalea sp. TaxID=1798908 RepID=UPI00374FC4BA
MPKESFFLNRIKSVGFALKGMFLLLRTEASIKVQFVIALITAAAGFYFEISVTEWIIQCLAIGMVMGIEGMNTAVEKLSDFVQPNHDEKIGFIKDVSAGAVMIVSILASIIGMLIYVPKIF